MVSDEITEAYRRLRRLVMDYLGLRAMSPTQSEPTDTPFTGVSQLDRDGTDTITGGSANMGQRTWSKPSLPDSASQTIQAMRAKAMSPLPPPSRGVVVRCKLFRVTGI